MNKTAKKWLGVGSFIIIGLMLILSAFIVIKIFSVIGTAISYGMTASEIDMLFYSAMPSFMLTAVFAFIISVANIILMVYYIILEAKDTNEGSSSKVLWILGLIFLSSWIYPFYWYFRVWKRDFSIQSRQYPQNYSYNDQQFLNYDDRSGSGDFK